MNGRHRDGLAWWRLDQRLGDVLEWTTPARCILFAVVMLIFHAWYTVVVSFGLRYADLLPYLNRPFVETIWPVTLAVPLVVWPGIIGAALVVRRHGRGSGLLVSAMWLYYFAWFGGTAYFVGPHTNLYAANVLLGGAALGFLLFDKRAVLLGVVVFVLLVLGTTMAEQTGLVPYAPIFTESPFRDGRLDTLWLMSLGGTNLIMLVAFVLMNYYVVTRLQDREARLARATRLIRRYVPSQLAHDILSGDYVEPERPERRKLTLFFSDIEGFTETADRLEPEDLSALLNEYLSEMTTIADEHGGTVSDFVGDGIMILLGAPHATDDRDHALRAVRMAIAMQRRMAVLRARWFENGLQCAFHVRMGINTGAVSVGNFGSPDRKIYSAIGNQANLTARIQARCEPGRVLLSHATWALVKDAIRCTEKGEIEAKGIHYPVRVYEVADL